MIAPPGGSQILWQSPDALMAAGQAQLSRWIYSYVSLGPRLLNLADVQGLTQSLKKLSGDSPLLLLSNCPGFALSPTEETQGLVFAAGAYRAWQQKRKAKGGLSLSYLEQIAVGGVYLMHGLSAQHRAAAEGTLFYDTVPNRPPVPLAQAQAKGLVDEILPGGQLENWVATIFSQHYPQAEP